VVVVPPTCTCRKMPDSTRIVIALFASSRSRMMLLVPPLPFAATPTCAYSAEPVASNRVVVPNVLMPPLAVGTARSTWSLTVSRLAAPPVIVDHSTVLIVALVNGSTHVSILGFGTVLLSLRCEADGGIAQAPLSRPTRTVSTRFRSLVTEPCTVMCTWLWTTVPPAPVP
jgi:hypothetical protein